MLGAGRYPGSLTRALRIPALQAFAYRYQRPFWSGTNPGPSQAVSAFHAAPAQGAYYCLLNPASAP